MTDFAYIGIEPCGCVVAATVDDPNRVKEVAKDVSDFIKSGLRIERVTCDEVRNRLGECKHGKGTGAEQIGLFQEAK